MSYAIVDSQKVMDACSSTIKRIEKLRARRSGAIAARMAATHNQMRKWLPFLWLSKKVTPEEILAGKTACSTGDTVELFFARMAGEDNIVAAKRLSRLSSCTTEGCILVSSKEAQLIGL